MVSVGGLPIVRRMGMQGRVMASGVFCFMRASWEYEVGGVRYHDATEYASGVDEMSVVIGVPSRPPLVRKCEFCTER